MGFKKKDLFLISPMPRFKHNFLYKKDSSEVLLLTALSTDIVSPPIPNAMVLNIKDGNTPPLDTPILVMA